MSMSASFAHVRDVQIHDDGQLQELIRSYQHTLHKYFNISISHTRHIDEDTEADILEDKTKQVLRHLYSRNTANKEKKSSANQTMPSFIYFFIIFHFLSRTLRH
eukprot:TRINITY_DN463_c0_g1_i14.p1 TRINITY_DN463_c0_g1~~TRINITY_DN463_c0_g1_i14.p1  ORF type:complete len:104 (-),score=8.73 TRINITY_DN463_c0_g1_i14:652-963(-)